MRVVCGLAIDRAPDNGHVATADAHVRVRLATHVRIEPPSVLNACGSRAHTSQTTAGDHAPRLREPRLPTGCNKAVSPDSASTLVDAKPSNARDADGTVERRALNDAAVEGTRI